MIKANYVYGSLGSNDCPEGHANVLTKAECQAAAVELGLTDRTSSDESTHKAKRPKGCFYTSSSRAYFNPHEGVPSNPQHCEDQECRPICKATFQHTSIVIW